MKLVLFPALLFCITTSGQVNGIDLNKETPATNSIQLKPVPAVPASGDIRIDRSKRWRLDGNKILTGGLLYTAGAAKGFNEGLQFNWNGFHSIFPKANAQWFWPSYSFKNKYKDGDPAKGPKFPFSTSLFVMVTDQYHLNNFIQRAAFTGALVIKIGEGKKPLRHYLFDVLYYTVCYQAGFHSIYTPIKNRN
ncbi:MAG: hypothetical protein SGI83_04500 [Bacteroidota bacterium]|nr:hypothetical protein [Bacteroidota bacterium]